LATFITDLHDSEINGEISWFFENVWGAKIGDKLNGYLAETRVAFAGSRGTMARVPPSRITGKGAAVMAASCVLASEHEEQQRNPNN
jgi:hypothetical protein